MKTTMLFLTLLLTLATTTLNAQCDDNTLPLTPNYTWTETAPGQLTLSWDPQPGVPFWELYFRVKRCGEIWEPFPTVILDGSVTSYVLEVAGLEIFTSHIKPSCNGLGNSSANHTYIEPSDMFHWVYLDCDECPNFAIIPLCGWSDPLDDFPTFCSDFCADEVTHLALLIEQTNPNGPISYNGTFWTAANNLGQITWFNTNGVMANAINNGVTLDLALEGWAADEVDYAIINYFLDGVVECQVSMPEVSCFTGGNGGQYHTSFDEFLPADVSVYPNPCSGILNIDISASSAVDQVDILDMNGKVLQSYRNRITDFDLKNFASGVYFVKVVVDGEIIVKKVIRN